SSFLLLSFSIILPYLIVDLKLCNRTLKSISEIDLTDLMKLTLKENEKQLQKQIEFWQREFRFWE
ncbi:hypothetical protein ACQ1ZV_14150, partial [Enterococcus faecalis]